MKSAEPAAYNADYENRLKKTEFNALRRNDPVAFCTFDTRLRYIHLNKIIADINGGSVKDHIGKIPWDIVPAVGDQTEFAIKKVLETGAPLLVFELCGETAADSLGKINGISVTAVEITDMEKAQPTLQENGVYLTCGQMKRLRNKQGMINVLADMMKDSLSAIKSTLNLLENNPADEKLVRHGLKTARLEQRRAEYFAKSISDILAVKKIPLKKERVELCSFLRQSTAEYSAKLREVKIEFEAAIPSAPIYIDADATELHRILDNMLHLIMLLLLPREKAVLLAYEDSGTSEVSVVIHLINTHHLIKIIPVIATKDFPELNYDMMKQIMASHGGRFEVKIEEIGLNPQYIFRFPQKAAKKK
jgi:hypothetical protein